MMSNYKYMNNNEPEQNWIIEPGVKGVLEIAYQLKRIADVLEREECDRA